VHQVALKLLKVLLVYELSDKLGVLSFRMGKCIRCEGPSKGTVAVIKETVHRSRELISLLLQPGACSGQGRALVALGKSGLRLSYGFLRLYFLVDKEISIF